VTALLAVVLAVAQAGPPEDAREVDPLEPDFTVVNLPTTLRLPRHTVAFRITHRFDRGLGEGDFGDLAADAFGFDAGAQIGLELRFGRTSERVIEFFAQQELIRPRENGPGLAALASLEALDNFQDEHSARLGLVASWRLGQRAVLYAAPSWIGNTNQRFPEDEDDSTVVLGLGTRVRLGGGSALTAEVHPRLAGFEGGPNAETLASFGIEHRVGGHTFQINVSRDLGTTPAQLARGRQGLDDWFLGFNISRKFF
jgi:hypothetical protein